MSIKQATSRPKRVRVDSVPNLYRRPADGRYEAGYTGTDGRWRMKTLAARTLTEAKAELRQVLGRRDQRQDVTPSRLTLNEVADQLLAEFESKVARGERSERTLEIYRQRWNTHIRPTLGRRRIQSVGVGEVARFLAELRRKTSPRQKKNKPPELLSNWTVRGVLNVLNVVLEHAVKHEYLASNPVPKLTGEKPPARNRTKARILEAEEVALLIDHAPTSYRTLIFTAVYTGMRQSELLGLRWQDIDFDAGTIHVRHQLSRATKTRPAHVLPLKTDSGERHIDIAPALARELATHSLGSRHSKPEDFVFATETGKPLYYRNVSARGLDKAADKAGLNAAGMQRISFHDLRHTAITHLIRSGADAAQVSRFAGHSKVSTTLDLYVGEFEKRKVNDSGARLAAVYAGVPASDTRT
jgi:integrase